MIAIDLYMRAKNDSSYLLLNFNCLQDTRFGGMSMGLLDRKTVASLFDSHGTGRCLVSNAATPDCTVVNY